jgi:trans-aconitate methyltransferase
MGEMDQEFWNESYRQDPDQVRLPDHFLEQEVENLRPGSAVDLVCGVGHNALMLAAVGWQVTGIDWSEEAISLARQAARAEGVVAKFIAADITAWEPPQWCDLVISTYALPGGEESKRVLETAMKSLAPDGTLIVVEWDKSMTAEWHVEEDDLMSVEEIVANLPGLESEKAEVRQVINPFGSEPQGEDDQGTGQRHEAARANVALVRVRKPG